MLKNKKDYSVYLRIRPDFEKDNEYDKIFFDTLNSYCAFESQSGLCNESYNGSDEGYELFSVGIDSFQEAKDIALKCAILWKVGVVELIANDYSFCIKYSEPSIVGRKIPDLPILSETYHLNKYNNKYVIYKTILFDISTIFSPEDMSKVKVRHIKFNASIGSDLYDQLSKIKQNISVVDNGQTGGNIAFLKTNDYSQYHNKYIKYKTKYLNMKK